MAQLRQQNLALGPALSPGDPDIAAIPALPGFNLDLRALVTPEASVWLRGGDLVIGPAFGPILTFVNFVRATAHGGLAVTLPHGGVISADRLVARLRVQQSLAIGQLTA
jgi:hypothetical protein